MKDRTLALLSLFSCFAAVAQAQTDKSVENSYPFLKTSVHVRGTMVRRDVTSNADFESYIRTALAENEKSYRQQYLSQEVIKYNLAAFENNARNEHAVQKRELELWTSGDKWVLVEKDLDVKSDVFTGANNGVEVWYCDGTNLVDIMDNGFRAMLWKPGVPCETIMPDVPPLGVGYCAMPVAVKPQVSKEMLARVKKVPCWDFTCVPSYYFIGADPAQTGQIADQPNRFPVYSPGWVRPGRGSDGRYPAEIVSGLLSSPLDKWEFSNYKKIGSTEIAFQTVWNNFKMNPDHTTTPHFERTFTLTSVDLGQVDSSVFSLDKYLKNRANMQQFISGTNFIVYKYEKSKTWDELAAGAIPQRSN